MELHWSLLRPCSRISTDPSRGVRVGYDEEFGSCCCLCSVLFHPWLTFSWSFPLSLSWLSLRDSVSLCPLLGVFCPDRSFAAWLPGSPSSWPTSCHDCWQEKLCMSTVFFVVFYHFGWSVCACVPSFFFLCYHRSALTKSITRDLSLGLIPTLTHSLALTVSHSLTRPPRSDYFCYLCRTSPNAAVNYCSECKMVMAHDYYLDCKSSQWACCRVSCSLPSGII